MHYPALIVDTAKLRHNTRVIMETCAKHNIRIAAVSKCYAAIPALIEAQIQAGIDMIADSRVENLQKMAHLPVKKMLLRIPMLSQVQEVVRYADISLNSELKVIRALSFAAVELGKEHEVILMVDVGDLREGVMPADALGILAQMIKLPGIVWTGLGANYGCLGGIMPDRDNLMTIVTLAEQAEERFGIKCRILTGGNSCTLHVLANGGCPPGINHLRLGENILLGYDHIIAEPVSDCYRDVFTLQAELVEIKEKPSKPIGRIGLDAFGKIPEFADIGVRKRGILAVGRQDVCMENMRPRQEGIQIIGESSDHLVVDLTDSPVDWQLGDVVEFDLLYGGILNACTSAYVEKVIL